MDSLLYARLLTSDTITDVLDDRIFQSQPEPHSALSVMYYLLLGVERLPNMSGPDDLQKCQYGIDVFSQDPTVITHVLDAVEVLILSWRDENVQGCFLVNRVMVPEPGDVESFHGQCVFDCWWNGTGVVEEGSSSSSP